jgi:hypothetical protein
MTQYLVATGHDVALGSLSAIVPQPRTIGLQHTRRQFAASGIVIDELSYVELLFSMLETVAQLQALLTQFGVLTATTADVSVYVQDENYDWQVYNGVAVKPLIGVDGHRQEYFLRDFTILVKSLQAQA